MNDIFEYTKNNLLDMKEREIQLFSVIQNLTEAIWSIDLTTEPYEIKYHNNPLEVFGNTQKLDSPPKTMEEWQNLIHPEDKEKVLDRVVNCFSKGTASYSYRIKRAKNKYYYQRDRISIFYENEKPVRLDGITIDIDQIRRTRLSLEFSQKRLKSIVDALPDAVFINAKKSGKVIFANEFFFKAYEMSPDDFLGKRVIQFYKNFEGRRSYIEKLRNDGHVQGHELVLNNKKGENFWVSASTMPLRFQDEDCFITILQDITDRKTLEHKLKESNERYQLAVEGTNDAIWEYHFTTKRSYISPQFWEGTGFQEEENPLDDLLVAKYLLREDLPAFKTALKSCLKNRQNKLTLEFRLKSADNSMKYVLFKAGITYSDKGEPIRAVGSLSNITALKSAQLKLRESQAKYKLISENSNDCVCLQDTTGKFVFVSPSSKDILGYTPEELTKLRLHEVIKDEFLEEMSETMLRVLKKQKRTASITYLAKHKNGHFEWLETVGGAVYDEQNDKVLYLQTATRKVTERIEAQRRLKESEEKYKLITENATDIVALMDIDGNYTFISPSITEIMGYHQEEVVGKNVSFFIHPDDLPEVLRDMNDSLKKKIKDKTLVFRYRHKNGNYRWMQVNGGVILNEQDEPIYFRANKIDITEKLATEQKLREQEEKYKLVSENSGDVIGLHKTNADIIFISPSCQQLLGYTEEELLEINPLEIIKEEYRASIKSLLESTTKTGEKDVKISFEIQHKNKSWIWVETSLSAVVPEDGEVTLLQSSTRDISERIKALEKERQLSRLKSSFISMASHEFRTPLTTIQSSNELISMHLDSGDAPVDQRMFKHVSRIRIELNRLNSLLKDVFTLGRLDVGKTNLSKDFTSLKSIVKQVIIESLVPYRGRKVELKVIGEERQLVLDSQLISHALSNLIVNALKYSEGKPDPAVTINYKPKDVEVCVQDFGIGIPVKDQNQLFESFSRASNVGDIEGTGLGLVIVKQFIEMHGGQISYTSQLGEGSEFKIQLPDNQQA